MVLSTSKQAMEWRKQLEPIHYDTALFKELLDRIKDGSDYRKFEATVGWNGSTVTFDDPYEIIDDRSIPDTLRDFRINYRDDSGYIRVTGFDRKSENIFGVKEMHEVTIEGDKEFVKRKLQSISEFEAAQSNDLARWLSKRSLRRVQTVLGASLVFTFIVGTGSLSTFPLPQSALFAIAIQIGMIGLLELPKRTYPFIAVMRHDTTPPYKTWISVVSVVTSVVGTLLTLVGLLL